MNFNSQAQEVFAGVSTSKYEFTTPMFWPLYRKKVKAREPELVAAQYLIAEAGICVLGVTQPVAGLEMAEGAENATATEVPTSTLKPVVGGPVPGVPMAGPGPSGAHGPGAGSLGLPIEGARPPRGRGPSGAHETSAPVPMMEGMVGMAGSTGMEARGKRFVAVRAIVPIKEQIERVMKALNLSYAEASAMVEYTDFVLERQTAIAGPDPWAGKWETVSLDTALEVLRESADFDPDPVPSDLQDAVFTMPLPYRLLRYWGDLATHPNIKQFRLSEEEMQRELKLQAKMLEEAQKMQLETQSKYERKGLVRGGPNGAVVNDIRQMAQSAMRGSEGANMMRSMASYMNEGANGPRMGVGDIKERLTASGRLYLFRFFDFDVEPGMAYRYRVKLQLRNPNFERPYEEVENESVNAGAYRDTSYSNISNPTVVPETVQYFLKDIDRDSKKRTVAAIDMFEWHTDLGTMLTDTLKSLNIGSFIAEKKKSLVLDPATPSFEEKEVTFASEDMLVDAFGDLEIPTELHPDLNLKPERGRTAPVGLISEALVATSYGDLKQLDTVSESRTVQALKKGVDEERKGYEYLKDAPKESGSLLDSGIYPGSPMPPGGATMGPGGPPARNPRRRSPAASPYGAGPAAPSPAGARGRARPMP